MDKRAFGSSAHLAQAQSYWYNCLRLHREKPMGSGASLLCRSRDGHATVYLHPEQGGRSLPVPDGTSLRLRGERDDSWLVEYVGSEYLIKKHNTTAAMVRARALNRDGHASVFLHSQSQGPSVEVPNGTDVVVKGQAGDSIIVLHAGVERLVKKHNASDKLLLIDKAECKCRHNPFCVQRCTP